ncbi:PREDICTED: EGF-like repeat and discoidin I-like domain-containing protein 3 [Acropora digitifera]|uniref:EGF-like repeat and discoidin I-like domain-containing protein 3 n=1 Tax=Acropora digitifera TaxID=70779 RepID=UPI00077A6733|nr:PREDICTED: EGF-like repeat and discoidin I-like domain-containing protein 3 [Acropora digitifera]
MSLSEKLFRLRFMLVFSCLAHQSKSLIIEGDRGLRRALYGENVFYVYFVLHQDQYLRGTPLKASLEVASPSECMLECLNNHECFSFNIASAYNEKKTLRCEILSEDKYRNAKDLIDSQVYQHYSIKVGSLRNKHHINECLSSPCQNGATCSDEVNKYSCTCQVGYIGYNCQTDINECLSSPCQNGATCSDEVNKYSCACQVGYRGYNCQTDINECLSSPCQNGATCSDEVNKYSCTCQVGYIGYNCQTACQAHLGMQNRKITAAQISASSQFGSKYSPEGARLFNQPSGSQVGCWSAVRNNLHQWIQIDLRTKTRVTQVATQGRRSDTYKQWVTRYKLLFSDDGISYEGFVAQGDSVVKVTLSCCLDILEDMTALGMESGAINDSRISASSSYDIYHGPPRARLHTMKTSSGKGAWSSKIADAHQWIQVDLVELKNVTYIATQGRNGVNQYVTMYKLEESSDGVNFTSYKMQGDSSATVFAGNSDRDTVIFHRLAPPITARFIRLRPTAWRNFVSLRMELYTYRGYKMGFTLDLTGQLVRFTKLNSVSCCVHF